MAFFALQFLRLSPTRRSLIQNLPGFCSPFPQILPLRGLSSKKYLGTCDTGLRIVFAGCVTVKPSSHSCLGTRVVPGPLGRASACLRRQTSQFFSPVWLDQAALSHFSARSHCFREGKARGRDQMFRFSTNNVMTTSTSMSLIIKQSNLTHLNLRIYHLLTVSRIALLCFSNYFVFTTG